MPFLITVIGSSFNMSVERNQKADERVCLHVARLLGFAGVDFKPAFKSNT